MILSFSFFWAFFGLVCSLPASDHKPTATRVLYPIDQPNPVDKLELQMHQLIERQRRTSKPRPSISSSNSLTLQNGPSASVASLSTQTPPNRLTNNGERRKKSRQSRLRKFELYPDLDANGKPLCLNGTDNFCENVMNYPK